MIEDCLVLVGEKFNLSLKKFDLLRGSVLRGLLRMKSLLLGPNLRNLWHHEIGSCEELTWMGNLQALTSIRSLRVSKCPKLTTGVGAGEERDIGNHLPSIKDELQIDEPLLLAVLLEEQGLNSLEALEIRGCSQDRPFSTEQEDLFLQLTSIKVLIFVDCENLPSLPANLKKLSSLKDLIIWRCPKMEWLPNMPTSLDVLWIWDCNSQLKEKYRVGGPLHHKINHIPKIHIF